jgi:hypothetical protein
LELSVQRSDGEETQATAWPVSSIGLRTEFSASLKPLSVRVAIVLNVGSNQESTMNETALLHQTQSRRPDWDGGFV